MISRCKIAIIIAALMMTTGCKQDLYKGLSERDVNEMMAILLDAKLSPSKQSGENGSYTIRVEDSELSASTRLLSSAGYPRDNFKSVDEVFPGGKMIQTAFEQHARFAFAISQDLGRSIATLQGVSSARVHVALAQSDIRGQTTSPASAAVVIRYGTNANLAELAAQARSIVASGVEGMAIDNVKVIMSPQETSTSSNDTIMSSEPAKKSAPALNSGAKFDLTPRHNLQAIR